jgi:hypothetical protein
MLTVNQLIGFTLRTGAAAAAGSIVVVILRHEPLKSAAGAGSITNAGGATDAQITYPVQVK